MRTQRLGLVQTPDQLRFSYIAILHGADRASKGQLDEEEEEEEDSDTDEEGVASENDSEEDRTAENQDKPPPLPPRASDSNIKTPVVKEDASPPAVLKRTVSLSGSSSPSMSVTPEPPNIKEESSPQPPPLPPRDHREPFLGEREEGNPPVEVPSSLNAESSMMNSDIHNSRLANYTSVQLC